MSPRKPPRLATWLLNRSGLARQNPPLVGDLLEEFRDGRSSAWYWRQTLVVMLFGLARNARFFWRPLTGTAIGWVIEAGVAFALLRIHFPPYLPYVFWAIAGIGVLNLLRRWMFLQKTQNAMESGDRAMPTGLVESAGDTFIVLLISYCLAALSRRDMTSGDFIFIQVAMFLYVKVLLPGADRMLTKLNQP